MGIPYFVPWVSARWAGHAKWGKKWERRKSESKKGSIRRKETRDSKERRGENGQGQERAEWSLQHSASRNTIIIVLPEHMCKDSIYSLYSMEMEHVCFYLPHRKSWQMLSESAYCFGDVIFQQRILYFFDWGWKRQEEGADCVFVLFCFLILKLLSPRRLFLRPHGAPLTSQDGTTRGLGLASRLRATLKPCAKGPFLWNSPLCTGFRAPPSWLSPPLSPALFWASTLLHCTSASTSVSLSRLKTSEVGGSSKEHFVPSWTRLRETGSARDRSGHHSSQN